MAAIVLLSFPLTYYWPIATASRQFHFLHHLHALAFFAWIGLYVWQTQLVANAKIARYRKIKRSRVRAARRPDRNRGVRR